MKQRKDPLTNEQRVRLDSIHKVHIAIEVSLVLVCLSVLTMNVSSALPVYGVICAIILMIAGLGLFIFGVHVTSLLGTIKKLGKPLAVRLKPVKRWIAAVWISAALIIVFTIAGAALASDVTGRIAAILVAGSGIGMFVSIIGFLVSSQHAWRRFNKRKRPPVRLIAYGVIVLNLVLLFAFGSYTTTEDITYETITNTDANLELGQSEVRQTGKNGKREVRHNLLFGFATSTDETAAVDEIIAKGSRRYQYMYCSNGSYRYYTAEQFKDPNVGFTHQTPDLCAQNGAGTQTTIADVPPAEKVIQQVPTYYSAPYRSYTTTCNSSYFSSSVTCRTY